MSIKSIVQAIDTRKYDNREILKNHKLFPQGKILRMCLTGMSSSGKSTWIANCLMRGWINAHRYMIVSPSVTDPLYGGVGDAKGVLKDFFDKIDEAKKQEVLKEVSKYNKEHKKKIHSDDIDQYLEPTALFAEELPQDFLNKITDGKKSWCLVLDDCIMNKNQMRDYCTIFVRSRHKAVHRLFSSQNYFSIPKILRNQCNGMVLFNGLTQAEITLLRRELSAGITKENFMEGMNDALKERYSWVFFNFNEPDPDQRYVKCDMKSPLFKKEETQKEGGRMKFDPRRTYKMVKDKDSDSSSDYTDPNFH